MASNLSFCPICKRRHKTAYWNAGEDIKSSWFHCCACNSTYTIDALARKIGNKAYKFIKNIQENRLSPLAPKTDELQRMGWPAPFISISSPRSKAGQDYLTSRGLSLEGQVYYDIDYNGIAFPLYYKGFFCGAQIRLLEPWTDEEGKPQKMTTITGTKTSLLFYNWNQDAFPRPYKAIIVVEGPLDCLSIEQALNRFYGSTIANPFKIVATLGSGISNHHLETLSNLKNLGYKIILAPDKDPAGFKMLEKSKEWKIPTHVMLTDKMGEDWNDCLKTMGHIEFAKFMITRMNPIS